MTENLDWSAATWTHAPENVTREGDALRVRAVEGSDAWRHTAYGFVHDTEHALLAPFAVGEAMEVEFEADFSAEFDQAGVFVSAGDERWMKAGVEYAEGVLNVGAVVTDVMSDWSVSPVPEWQNRRLRVRVSRGPDALIVRIGAVGEPLRLVRITPFAGDADASAGPMVCAPTRAGLEVLFTAWRRTDADTSVH